MVLIYDDGVKVDESTYEKVKISRSQERFKREDSQRFVRIHDGVLLRFRDLLYPALVIAAATATATV